MTHLWLMDDHTILCDPRIVADVLTTVDEKTEMPERGGKRNRAKHMSSTTPRTMNYVPTEPPGSSTRRAVLP
eukprot:10582979-Lingulodinium_polyedra.AAC.1